MDFSEALKKGIRESNKKKEATEMKNIESVKIGECINYKSYEGINSGGRGKVIDKFQNNQGKWYATIEGIKRVVCISNEDIKGGN